MWAKCDILATVAFDRLDRVKVRDVSGRRTYEAFHLNAAALEAVRAAVKAALGFP